MRYEEVLRLTLEDVHHVLLLSSDEELGHATLQVDDLISAILPSDEDLGHATLLVVNLISASLYPLFLCPLLVYFPGLPAVPCLLNGKLELPASPVRSFLHVRDLTIRDSVC